MNVEKQKKKDDLRDIKKPINRSHFLKKRILDSKKNIVNVRTASEKVSDKLFCFVINPVKKNSKEVTSTDMMKTKSNRNIKAKIFEENNLSTAKRRKENTNNMDINIIQNNSQIKTTITKCNNFSDCKADEGQAEVDSDNQHNHNIPGNIRGINKEVLVFNRGKPELSISGIDTRSSSVRKQDVLLQSSR